MMKILKFYRGKKMKKELIGVLICTLLIVIAVLPTTGTTTICKNTSSEERSAFQKLSPRLDRISDILSEFVPGEMIIKFREDVDIYISSSKNIVTTEITSIDTLNEKYGVISAEKLFGEFQIPSLSTIYKFILPAGANIPAIVAEYNKDPCVIYAEPNYIYHTFAITEPLQSSSKNVAFAGSGSGTPVLIPDDPLFDQQWALNQSNDCDIDAPEAWCIETGSPNVTIAIIDTGVDYNHPDLAANIWHDPIYGNPGYDFVDIDTNWYIEHGFELCPDEDYTDPDGDPMDVRGHGTHCSGIAGAVTNNGIGIAGVSWNCKIMPVRSGFKIIYLSRVYGLLEFDDVALGIIYATDNGANVISMSFGGGDSDLVHDAINYAYSQGVVLVAAAGNDNTNAPSYPAGYDNVIAVAATDSDDSKASFSNYGSWVDVAAPGVDILSTLPNNAYGSWSGTSMACPHVTGLAALILSKNQSFDQEEVRTIICDSADRLPPPEEKLEGRINAFNALLRGPGPATAEIFFPKHGGEINGVINIQGSAYGEGFQYFTIEYGKCTHLIPGNWVEIINSTIPVQNDMLTSLNTNAMGEGLYDIRLTMVCSNGIYKDNIWSVVNNEQNTFYVDDDGGSGVCTSIREGILNAGNGDTIFVYNGTYYENVLIWKSIKLIGEEKNTTIVDGNYKGSVININSDNVVVRGFTLKNIKSYGYFEGKYGCIKINPNINNVLVTDNIITPGEVEDGMYGEGILIRGADNNIIQNNIIFYDKHVGCAVGVKIVYNAHYNNIYNNEIYECHCAVSIYPMVGGSCNNNIIDSNYFHDLNIGVSINEIASETKVISNNITNCGMWGVFLFWCEGNLIDNNTITHSGKGVYLAGSGCENNIVTNNNFSYNNVGVYARGWHNKIYYNNFVNNTKNAHDEYASTWYKFILFGKSMGNYWDDYTGTDNNGDGIGDTPYNIPGGNSKDKYPLMKPYNGSQSNQNSQSQQSNQQSKPSQNQQQISQQMNQLLHNIFYNLILRHQTTNR